MSNGVFLTPSEIQSFSDCRRMHFYARASLNPMRWERKEEAASVHHRHLCTIFNLYVSGDKYLSGLPSEMSSMREFFLKYIAGDVEELLNLGASGYAEVDIEHTISTDLLEKDLFDPMQIRLRARADAAFALKGQLFAIFDYKFFNNQKSLNNFKDNIKKNTQFLFYNIMFNSSDLPARKIFYYLILKDSEGGYSLTKKQINVNEVSISECFNLLKPPMIKYLINWKFHRDITPSPRSREICGRCDYLDICEYPEKKLNKIPEEGDFYEKYIISEEDGFSYSIGL